MSKVLDAFPALPEPPKTIPAYINPNLSNRKNLFGMPTWYMYTIFPITVLLAPIIIPLKIITFALSISILIISMWAIGLGTDVSKPIPKNRIGITNLVCRVCSRCMSFTLSGFIIIEKNRKLYTHAKVKPRIIVANHSSVMDAMSIGSFGAISPVAKESLATVWAYRQVLVGLRTILVHRPFEKSLKKGEKPEDKNVQTTTKPQISEEKTITTEFPASDFSINSNSGSEFEENSASNDATTPDNTLDEKSERKLKAANLLKDLQQEFKEKRSESHKKKLNAIVPKSVSEAICERAQPECSDYPPVSIFPEGTVTNDNTLLKFRTGAFRPLVPVQPLTFRYYSPLKTDWLYENIWYLILSIFLNPIGIVVIEYLPPIAPTEKEIKETDVKSFADRVADAMAENMGIQRVPYTSEDTMYCSGYKHGDYSKCSEAYINDYISRGLGTYEEICKALGKGKTNPKSGKFKKPFKCITNEELKKFLQKKLKEQEKKENQ